MEVDKYHFKKELFSILKHISRATYVSFDLEMSGITTRPKFGSGDRSHDVGKPSLQQHYEETKNAAETFQVVQFGITCVEEERDKEYYIARPYNFYVSPLTPDSGDLRQLERTFSFSSSACQFLKDNQFDFGKLFNTGISYLSRGEEDEVRETQRLRAEKNSKIPDIVISPDETKTVDFYRRARKIISAWVKQAEGADDYVNIDNPDGAMNGFQRRLIHQLVRNEFPGLRTFAKNDGYFMQVERLNVEKEANHQKRKLDGFNAQVAKTKGLRWIFEALAGGDLSGIDPKWFCDENNADPEEELKSMKRKLARVMKLIQEKTRVIVGHNLFTDLAFIYNAFVGPLPRNVKHFQQDIHELFPVIIDTKFLATQNADAMNPRGNLKELLAPFKKIHMPVIVLHEDHMSYGLMGKEHEAGYDSWMTAELFIKLTGKLYSERKHLLDDADNESITGKISDVAYSDDGGSSDEAGGASLSLPTTNGTIIRSGRIMPKDSPGWHSEMLNPYSVLENLSEDFGVEASEAVAVTNKKQWIPAINNSFWDVYTNKLRVNAVEGGVCDLNAQEN